MSKYIFTIILIIPYLLSYSQDPNYFTLGASELKNADIYSILHTQNQKLYIATNEGLYEYKHGKMFQITKAKEQRDVSLFNLVENSKNEVFCFNLNGQIFKIENNELKLYFQFPEKFYTEYIEMFFDDIDRLIVSSGGCFAVSDTGFEEIFYSETYKRLKLNKLINGDLILVISDLDEIVKIKNGKAHTLHSELYNTNNHGDFHLFELNNQLITSRALFNLSNRSIVDQRSNEYLKFFQISYNEIWSRSSLSGVYVYKSKNDSIYLDTHYFTNTFISTLTIDDEGTIFLGTFGKGLFVIPSRRTETFDNLITGNNFKHIAADKHNIYISDIVKGIFVYNRTLHKTDLISKNKPNKVFAFQLNKSNLYNNYSTLFHGSNIGTGDVKNILEIDSTTFLMASSNGLLKVGNSNIVNPSLWKQSQFTDNSNIYITELFTKRCTDVAYDSKAKTLFVSTMSFLQALTPKNEILELSYNGFPIIANDLFFEDGLLWCATQNFGILVFKDFKIVKQINTKSGLNNNYVFKFEKKYDNLYISHKTGFQIYTIQSQEWMTVGTAEGVENGTVKDFCVQEDKIWFISNNQIISYSIDNINSNKPQLRLTYDSIKVNGNLASSLKAGNFKYYENNIAIFPTFNGLLYESEVKLDYTLEDTDNNLILESNPLSITDDLIEFKYLPNGEYKFYIKAKYRDIESFSKNYYFTINKAYWKTTWFFICCVFTLIGLISIFYRYRTRKIYQENFEKLEKQTLKTEAITSELKALRSQMNPHFIFNSLNSIQDLILKEDTDASYDYLVMFSDLVRNALSYSNQDVISLEKEIEFLRTYLELEKLRFGPDLEFKIDYKSARGLYIPSLIIQPFVENSIEHGVFHLKGKKKIQITFTKTIKNLICTIRDNGIGIEQSKKIQSRSSRKHEPYALEAIVKRLQILNTKNEENIGFVIEDILENEKIIGTKVKVRLPLIKSKIDLLQ